LQGNNGWIFLNSEDRENIQVQAKNGRVSLQMSHSKGMQQTSYTLGKEKDIMAMVVIENGTFTFSIEGDRISGEIKATGMNLPTSADQYISDFKTPSTYEAKITGEIHKSAIVEKLKTSMASSFNGQWETSIDRFKQIELQQIGQEVSGTYTSKQGDGIIKGIVQDNVLDFTWQDNRKVEEGRGFFRAVNNGGTLVGIIKEKTESVSEKKDNSLIASWQFPSFIAIDTFTPFDLLELKYFGQDLASEDRCERASFILDKVINNYLPKELSHTQPLNKDSITRVSIEKEREQESNVIKAGVTLISLIECNFKLGNYDKLLDSLNYGMKIQRFLSPEESASRLFRQFTAKITETLQDNIEYCNTMEANYGNLLAQVNGSVGIVGVTLDQDETTKEIYVSMIRKGLPADLAGILRIFFKKHGSVI